MSAKSSDSNSHVKVTTPELSELEFRHFQKLLFQVAGIHITGVKKSMVAGRLAKRLKSLGLANYASYIRCIDRDPRERQRAMDLLTTNETYFFREPKHFDFIRHHVTKNRPPGVYRVWSAACSSGEEPYSLAMLLDDLLGERGWEVSASDLSTQVLDKARCGVYPMERAERIPQPLLKKYCLRGIGAEEGTLLVDKRLRKRLHFSQVNLNQSLPDLGMFDLILLRNVLIYFNGDTKREVVMRVAQKLKRGGIMMVGHSESLSGMLENFATLAPSVYQKL